MNSSNKQSGFSLIELLTVMAVTLVLSGMIVGFTIDYWGNSANTQADLESFVSRVNAEDELRKLVSASDGLIIQNGIPDMHTLDADPSISSGQYWVPIHAIPGNFPVGSNGAITPILYFKRPTEDKTHNIAMNGAVPYDDEYVLYLDGTTKKLMLRTLANPNVANNLVTTSCPPAIASSSCPADKAIIDNLTSVDLRYFSRSGNPIDWTSVYDNDIKTYIGPDFPLAEAVELNLHLSQQAEFHGVNKSVNQTVIRIALLNF